MKRHTIFVKKGTRYLGDIKGFELPNGVFNKKFADCGATHKALTDEHKTILCCPRNELLKNKKRQHPEHLLVIGGVDKSKIIEHIENTEAPKILVSYDSVIGNFVSSTIGKVKST